MHNRFSLDNRIARYTQMSPEEWAAIPDNPRQRDTELHAKVAIKYLLVPQPPHIEVKMAVLPDGSKYKLDGHTRAYLWANHLIPVPDWLEVTMYELRNRIEAIQGYDWFDNALASERSTDIVQGAFRANGIRAESHMLRSGHVNTALKRLYRVVYDTNDPWVYDTVDAAVGEFADELKLFDEIKPTRALFPVGVQMGVLITLKRDREQAIEFWQHYAAQRGSKDTNTNTMDAVQALIEAVMSSKSQNRANKDITGDLFAKTLSAFQAYMVGQRYVLGNGLRALSRPTITKYAQRKRQ